MYRGRGNNNMALDSVADQLLYWPRLHVFRILMIYMLQYSVTTNIMFEFDRSKNN